MVLPAGIFAVSKMSPVPAALGQLVPVQVQEAALTSVAKVSVIETPVASLGPLLVMVRVKFSISPAITLLALGVLVIEMSLSRLMEFVTVSLSLVAFVSSG